MTPPWVAEDPSLAQVVEAWSRVGPDRVALRFQDEVLSYGDLATGARRLATALAQHGVRPGDRVCVLLDTSTDYVVVRLALSWLGAVEVALNTGFRGRALAHALGLAEAALAVVDAAYLPEVLAAAEGLPALATVVVRGPLEAVPDAGDIAVRPLATLAAAASLEEPPHHYAPGDPALVLFTSGSTGPSKGCLLPSRFVVRQAELFCRTLGVTQDDVLYAPFPLFHADGAIFTVAAAFAAGATAALSPRFSVSQFWDECRKHRVTIFDFMGATLTMLYKQPPSPSDRDHGVRMAWGVPAPEWAGDFTARFGIDLVEVYGLSDVGIVLYNQPGMPPPRGSCGRPVPAFDVAVHDERGHPVPAGAFGEIVVRPAQEHTILSAYVNDPAATEQAFRDGWFRTGDLAYRDEGGWFFFVGRLKDIIRRRGENISAFEVEQTLLEHPDVLEVAAYGVPSELTEEDLMVTLVVRPGSGLGAADLVSWAQQRLARHMVPRYLRIVDAMPRTETEKIAKHELKALGLTADTVDREAG